MGNGLLREVTSRCLGIDMTLLRRCWSGGLLFLQSLGLEGSSVLQPCRQGFQPYNQDSRL